MQEACRGTAGTPRRGTRPTVATHAAEHAYLHGAIILILYLRQTATMRMSRLTLMHPIVQGTLDPSEKVQDTVGTPNPTDSPTGKNSGETNRQGEDLHRNCDRKTRPTVSESVAHDQAGTEPAGITESHAAELLTETECGHNPQADVTA